MSPSGGRLPCGFGPGFGVGPPRRANGAPPLHGRGICRLRAGQKHPPPAGGTLFMKEGGDRFEEGGWIVAGRWGFRALRGTPIKPERFGTVPYNKKALSRTARGRPCSLGRGSGSRFWVTDGQRPPLQFGARVWGLGQTRGLPLQRKCGAPGALRPTG